MATTCSSCGCNNLTCGCKNSYLTTPPPCPTPADCPDQQPCSEVFDAQCIIYNGENIFCGQDIVVTEGATISQSLYDIVNYFCEKAPVLTEGIQCPEQPIGFISPEGTEFTEAMQDIVNYFCLQLLNIPIVQVNSGDNTTVTSNTEGNTTIYTVNALNTIVDAGDGISVTSNTVGNTTTYTVSNDGVKKYSNSGGFIAGVPTVVPHNLNSYDVILSVTSSSGLPYTGYVHGVDYTYTIVDLNTISLTLVPGGFANVTVIG